MDSSCHLHTVTPVVCEIWALVLSECVAMASHCGIMCVLNAIPRRLQCQCMSNYVSGKMNWNKIMNLMPTRLIWSHELCGLIVTIETILPCILLLVVWYILCILNEKPMVSHAVIQMRPEQ